MTTRKLIALVFAFALVLAACGDDDGGGNGFSDSFRQEFMSSCEADSPGGEYCSCFLDQLEQNFTEAELIKFAIEGTEEPPDEFFDMALACIGEVDLGG